MLIKFQSLTLEISTDNTCKGAWTDNILIHKWLQEQKWHMYEQNKTLHSKICVTETSL